MQTVDLSQLEAVIANLTDQQRVELEELAADELEKPFIPNPGPQTDALLSEADILLYGGAAGGGKSALEIGAWFLGHQSGIVLRREATQLDGLIEYCKQVGEPEYGHFVGGADNVFKRKDGGRLKFAGLKQPDDWRKHAGNARDFMAFDEAGEFLKEQVFSLIGWLRSTKEGQRCRVILGSNPPRGGDGEWLMEEFAPWLDPMHPNPAEDGKLRWAIVVAGVTEWVEGPGVYERSGEDYEALSRTFIPARLDDNPYLSGTKYRAVLQGLPEPLRSQLLNGDFLSGRVDHEWQIIPTAWITASNERWRVKNAALGGKYPRMLNLSCDAAMGGGDNATIAALCEDAFFEEILRKPGVEITDGETLAQWIVENRRNGADISIDATGGWGLSAKEHLQKHMSIGCAGLIASGKSGGIAKGNSLSFKNQRAEWWWRFREALDPKAGDHVALPPDTQLTAQLTAPRWLLKKTEIQVESKEDIRKRLGSSTDDADAVIQAWSRRGAMPIMLPHQMDQWADTAEEDWNPYG